MVDQDAVFKDCGQSILNDILAGDTCVMFAYGLSGSGKTCTYFFANETQPTLMPPGQVRRRKCVGLGLLTMRVLCKLFRHRVWPGRGRLEGGVVQAREAREGHADGPVGHPAAPCARAVRGPQQGPSPFCGTLFPADRTRCLCICTATTRSLILCAALSALFF